jgi:deazaflavin-dependent oxidoreductase (nitroreductase family)
LRRGSDRTKIRAVGLAEEQFVYVTTTGRKSGLPREIEIWFVTRGGAIHILAEHGRRAQWVMNVLQEPRVKVRLGPLSFDATARVLDEASDEETWRAAQDLARAKYNWGDGLPVEILPTSPVPELAPKDQG